MIEARARTARARGTDGARPPWWFWTVALSGLAWNAFGVVQFLAQFGATEGALMGSGMTAEQAALYAAQPEWMTFAFAVGVFGGAIGSLLLLLRRRLAVPVFAASLVGYVVLFVGDIVTGIFEVFGTPQVVILTAVVAIAAILLVIARAAAARQWLA